MNVTARAARRKLIAVHLVEPQLLGQGIYRLTEASRLSGVAAPRIRRWLVGYKYKTESGPALADPVFSGQLPVIDGVVAVSFLDLIEVRIVDALRRRGITWRTIRVAERNARELFGVTHPFATRLFKTDGRSIFASLRRPQDERPLIDLSAHQFAFRRVIEPLLKDVDFDAGDRAAVWRPLGQRRRVLLDPKRSFGQPIVREGVPTRVLAAAVKREESVDVVASWYEVERRAVRDAIEYESQLAA